MRRVSALVAALSVTAAGCSFSSVDPDASVSVSGRALNAAGKPLADTPVLLFKQADIGEVLFGTVLTVGSLGSVCLLPDAPSLCRKAKTARTDADGRYSFDLRGSDTQGTLGTKATMSVVFATKATGSTTVSFTAEEPEISLPDARLWKAAARVSQSSREIRLSYAALPGAAGQEPTYTASLFARSGQGALWTQPASGRTATIDPRILEDRPGAVAAGARATLAGGSGAGDLRVSFLSPRLEVRATAGAAPSRGRRCGAVTGTAPVKHAPLGTCAATDGDLDRPAQLRAPGGAVVTGAVIDRGTARPVSLVVARGLSGQFLVEVSADGTVWQTVATSSGAAAAIVPPGRPTARFVRLRSPAGLDESLLAEISVW